MGNSQSENKGVSFKKELAEYVSLVERIVLVLRNPTSPTHFNDLRQMIDELEILDRRLTSSNVMRNNVDIPDS
jgi:hypothetical protein